VVGNVLLWAGGFRGWCSRELLLATEFSVGKLELAATRAQKKFQ
jgi:hypothetical protein